MYSNCFIVFQITNRHHCAVLQSDSQLHVDMVWHGIPFFQSYPLLSTLISIGMTILEKDTSVISVQFWCLKSIGKEVTIIFLK